MKTLIVPNDGHHHPQGQFDSYQFTLSADFEHIVILSGEVARALRDLVSISAASYVTQFILDERFDHPQGHCNFRQFMRSSDCAHIVILSGAIE